MTDNRVLIPKESPEEKEKVAAAKLSEVEVSVRAPITMADDRVTFPEDVSDENEKATTKNHSETDSSINVEAPIVTKKAFVALNVIQAPYNCGKDQSMGSDGVCREPF